jgi:Putative Ig domain
MSPNFSRPATASPFRYQRACSTLLTLIVVVVLAVPQLFSAESPIANPNMIVPPWQHIKISATLTPGTVGVPYSAVISVNGGDAPYKFQEQNIPAGLVLNEQTGGISGTPQAAGAFTFAVWVTDAQSDRGLGWVSITIANKSNVSISVTPTSTSVNSGATAQFAATVSNSSNTAATWTASQGTVSSSGLFTAPTVTAQTSVVITATSVADSTKSATAVVSVAPAPSAKVSLEVLFPPTNPNTSDFKAVQQYLMSNPVVSGGNLTLEWGMIDQGSGQYDWSSIDAEIVPWQAAGKKVNLIVWANSDSTVATCSNGQTSTTGNCAVPAYVWKSLGPSNYTTCVTQYGTQQIPNYLDRTSFQLPYQQFMAAVIQKYGSNPEIGYIRFGLGHGGETYPVTGWNSTTAACGKAFTAWGVTVTTWETYLAGMMSYEATLHSTKQLMVGVTPMGAPNTVVPDYVAPLAVPMHVGFGSQGFQLSDITEYPNCTANWCNLFAQFAGQAPLELQTYLQSCPDNSCTTGSLVNLVPFAISHHATVLEIYYQDWLVAFDPSYPGNSEYGAAYAKVLTQAANTSIQ